MTWTPENNTTPTGLLTTDQLAALKERGPWLCYSEWGDEWLDISSPTWLPFLTYRRKLQAAPEAPALTEAQVAHVRAIFAEMLADKAAPQEPAPLRIEEGKFYRTRDGQKVGPITTVEDCEGARFYVEDVGLYFDDGTFGYGDVCRCRPFDAIAEWVDEAPTPAAAPTQDSVDWSQIARPFDWIARDEDGAVFAFDCAPTVECDVWNSDGRQRRIDALIPSYDPGTCGWRDSLICRPGKEGDA